MKKFLALGLPIFLLCQFAVAQKNGVSGTLADKDQKKPIKNAVVALVNSKDSVLYKFTRSDADGNFKLKDIENGNYVLLTTHPLFADYVDSIVVNNAPLDLGSIGILNKSKLLQEVIIKSGSPIRIKGDTTVYTADSFKVKDGASVEDLLRKMPGFQVDKDGKIKAMGETVKNVLVDGEEFFGNDPGMVLKNLQANIVQEVQVYDKKSDQAAFTGIDDGVKEKTVNLKLKANKKQGYFGKIEAAGGLPDNYNNSAMFNAFKGKRKFSAFGFMSNTGRTALGWQDADKYAGGEQDGMTSGSDDFGNTWTSYNSGEDGYYNGRSGIPKNWNGGLHYSNKYKGDSLIINSSYKYGKVNAPGFANTFSSTYLQDSSWKNNSTANSLSSTEKHNVSFSIENKLDSNNTLKFTNRASYNTNNSSSNYYEENLTNDAIFINNSTRKSNTVNKGQGYDGTLTWNHKFKKIRRTFSATTSAVINENDGTTFLLAFNNYYKGAAVINKDTTNQKTLNKSDTKTFAASFTYTEPLTKILSLGFTYSANISNSGNNRTVLKNNGAGQYTTKIDSLSNDFNFNKLVQRTGLTLRLVKKKLTANIGTAIAFNKFIQKNNSKNIRQDYDFTNFFPSAGFNLKLKGNKNIRLSYSGRANAPSLQQLQPIADNSNPLIVQIGNSNLKQSFWHNLNGGFGWSQPLSDNSIWSSFNYSILKNAFVQYSTIDTSGKTTLKTVNANGNTNYNVYFSYNFAVGKGKKKVNLSLSPDINFSRQIDFVNGIKNINNSSTYSLEVSLNKYVDDKYNFYIGPNISYTKSSSSINKISNTSFWSYGGWISGNFEMKKNLTLHTSADFSFRQKDKQFAARNNNYIKWDADVKKYIYKKEFSLKFGVTDILNQNRGYERNVSSYKTTESYYNTLKRTWLLTFGWEFTHSKKQAAAAETTAIIKAN